MYEIISKIIPIIALIFSGYIMKKKNMLKEESVNDIKKLLIDIALPAVLFTTFVNMEFKLDYLFVFLIVFLMMAITFYIGVALSKINAFSHALLPFAISGASFGLLGVPLFLTVFGENNLEKIVILGVGNEFFCWLLNIPALKMKLGNEKFSPDSIKNILKSSIIISIFAGIIFNVLGISDVLVNTPPLNGIYSTIQYLANISAPLIFITIGYGLKFDKRYLKQSAMFVILRYALVFTVGYAVKILLLDRLIPNDTMFDYAFFTFMNLPLQYSLSVFVSRYSSKEDNELINNVIVLNTVVCVIIYIIFIALIGIR